MPTNAEIHASIDLLIRQPHSSIVTDSMADLLDDMVDNIESGGALPAILTENTTIELNGFFLKIRQGGLDLFEIDPVNGTAMLRSVNGENLAITSSTVNETEAQAVLGASFNNDAKSVGIVAVANATLAAFTISGIMEFANNAAAVTGGLEAGMLYTTAGAIKIVTA